MPNTKGRIGTMAPEAKKQKLDAAAPQAVPTASCSSRASGSSGCSERLGSQSQSSSPIRSATRCSAASRDMPRAR
ncbi:hypothetical protein D3C84_1230530 [compost metagenome]